MAREKADYLVQKASDEYSRQPALPTCLDKLWSCWHDSAYDAYDRIELWEQAQWLFKDNQCLNALGRALELLAQAEAVFLVALSDTTIDRITQLINQGVPEKDRVSSVTHAVKELQKSILSTKLNIKNLATELRALKKCKR